ncbi:hypothetical protein PBY51_011352 [Eleginops maclovinus]|uniref:Uncharacterized protein n=1 Tax=Eleginops maclovinus TaxID=56733 RepID=A0AAN7XMZ6_ELEMC|nr:hypothetical protein PBY51_011352 [Eleginops maclovinus]
MWESRPDLSVKAAVCLCSRPFGPNCIALRLYGGGTVQPPLVVEGGFLSGAIRKPARCHDSHIGGTKPQEMSFKSR